MKKCQLHLFSITDRLIFLFFAIGLLLIINSAFAAHGENRKKIETEGFTIELPVYMQLFKKPDVLDNKSDLLFAYIEKGKKKSDSILLIITSKAVRSIKPSETKQALITMTSGLRGAAINSIKCKSVISDNIYTRIDGTDALHFEVNNNECKVVLEKYWCLIKGRRLYTIYIAMPEHANKKNFKEVEDSITDMKFKDA